MDSVPDFQISVASFRVDLLGWSPVSSSDGILDEAWQIEDRHGFSWWDSLLGWVRVARVA